MVLHVDMNGKQVIATLPGRIRISCHAMSILCERATLLYLCRYKLNTKANAYSVQPHFKTDQREESKSIKSEGCVAADHTAAQLGFWEMHDTLQSLIQQTTSSWIPRLPDKHIAQTRDTDHLAA